MKRAFAAAAVATLTLLLAPLAQAERADALKPLKVEGGIATFDQAAQTVILTGDVIASRGTMLLKAARAEIKEAPDGYRTLVLIAAPGNPASFRQKRDGGPDQWDEGQAERIEYDERTDVLKLSSNAIIRQLEGRKVVHEMGGEFISYDARKEVLLNLNDPSGVDRPGKGRASFTFYPRRTAQAAPQSAETGKQ
jgi:lipopolysaccharide export system protein LptA